MFAHVWRCLGWNVRVHVLFSKASGNSNPKIFTDVIQRRVYVKARESIRILLCPSTHLFFKCKLGKFSQVFFTCISVSCYWSFRSVTLHYSDQLRVKHRKFKVNQNKLKLQSHQLASLTLEQLHTFADVHTGAWAQKCTGPFRPSPAGEHAYRSYICHANHSVLK